MRWKVLSIDKKPNKGMLHGTNLISPNIHVFLVVILFGYIYMNSFNSSGLFLDIEIFVESILISNEPQVHALLY
jgi:hypothetical protein